MNTNTFVYDDSGFSVVYRGSRFFPVNDVDILPDGTFFQDFRSLDARGIEVYWTPTEDYLSLYRQSSAALQRYIDALDAFLPDDDIHAAYLEYRYFSDRAFSLFNNGDAFCRNDPFRIKEYY